MAIMNKALILQTYERIEAFLADESPERQKELVNILVDCWDLTQEGLGYVVGRLVAIRSNREDSDDSST